jgi:hypothetical protein
VHREPRGQREDKCSESNDGRATTRARTENEGEREDGRTKVRVRARMEERRRERGQMNEGTAPPPGAAAAAAAAASVAAATASRQRQLRWWQRDREHRVDDTHQQGTTYGGSGIKDTGRMCTNQGPRREKDDVRAATATTAGAGSRAQGGCARTGG